MQLPTSSPPPCLCMCVCEVSGSPTKKRIHLVTKKKKKLQCSKPPLILLKGASLFPMMLSMKLLRLGGLECIWSIFGVTIFVTSPTRMLHLYLRVWKTLPMQPFPLSSHLTFFMELYSEEYCLIF